MKKILALIMALCMLVACVACAEKTAAPATSEPAKSADAPAAAPAKTEAAPAAEAAPAEPVKLTLALRGGTYADVIQACIPAFEAENNCTIEVLALEEDDLHSKIALDSANKEGAYDLVMVDGSWKAELIDAEALLNLKDYGYDFDEDVIPATTAVSYGEDGGLYLAPYYGNVTVLMFSKTLAEAAGYTENGDIASMDDVLKICEAAKAAGSKGFIYRGDTPNNCVVDFMPILYSFGAKVIEDDNTPNVTSDAWKEAVNFYMQLIATGDAEKKDDLIASVDSGAGAMGIGWPGWYAGTNHDATAICAITGAAHTGDAAQLANVYGIWTIGVPSNAKNKELSVKLLAYLMDKDVQYSTIDGGGVPCRYSSLKDAKVLEAHPEFSVICDALEVGVYRPFITQWTDYYTALGTELSNIFNGVKDVDTALADAQAALEIVMAG